jgi:hypothetical protein
MVSPENFLCVCSRDEEISSLSGKESWVFIQKERCEALQKTKRLRHMIEPM